ncbi:hypothetical protein NUW54_g14447 [Trametes sanguinea]|uniref:Uncharacterized protein n=1 Tax=Trametes sanguinea TaxID=158606 RepID=A0ACC1MD67_9APHY|nr:hypothetical protein NUW54_g14447 [Trametes sanguinea]
MASILTASFWVSKVGLRASTKLAMDLRTKSQHTFADFSRILSNATYFDGNATKYDWVVNQGNIINTNSSGGELAMILTQDNGGTRLSSTRYVHYGTITARIKTGRWGGVVTAFITMSDIKDEIDWEFPGNQTTQGQSNYFWQGFVPQKTVGMVHGNLSDTFSNYHDYTVRLPTSHPEGYLTKSCTDRLAAGYPHLAH